MAEYIERDKLAFELCKVICGEERSLCVSHPRNCMQRLMQPIYKQPAADVAPVVHGQWKENDNFDDGFWVCSSCGFVSEATAAHKLYKFCPNCGADMREEQE